MLIDTPTYDKLAARLAAHDAWAEQFKQRSGWIVIPADANPPRAAKISNAGRAMIEVYEFRRDVPDRYFLYINERTRRATTWTGAPLGVVIFGREYRDNFGGRRVPVRIAAINGATYSGTYYKSSGSYARVRKVKG